MAAATNMRHLATQIQSSTLHANSLIAAAGGHNSTHAQETHFVFHAHAVEDTTSSDMTPKHRKHKNPNLPHHPRRSDSSESFSRRKASFQSLSIDSTNFSDSDDIWQ